MAHITVRNSPSGARLLIGSSSEEFEDFTFELEFDLALQLQGFTIRVFPRPIDVLEDEGGPFPVWADEPSVNDPKVTARLLRKIPLGEMVDHARVQILNYRNEALRDARVWRRLSDSEKRALFYVESPKTLNARRPGRRGRSELEHAELALEYVRCLTDSPRRPLKLLAERTGLDRRQLDGLLHQARRHGFLTSTSRGVSGGELTGKANKILEEHGESLYDDLPDFEYLMDR
jgi:hypothetical protein